MPFVYSESQPGRVEWTEDADTLWKRIANDQPLGKLRVGSIGADQAPTGTPTDSATSGTSSPSDDESESESSSTSSPSDSESSTTESPSSTTSPSDDESSPGIDASSDDLDFAGLCS